MSIEPRAARSALKMCRSFSATTPKKAWRLPTRANPAPRSRKQTGDVLGVHNCTVDINEGEILVLMGLSGSGKSTLLRAINRLNPISRGKLIVQLRRRNRSMLAACDDKAT
jgi:ABC-type proline/glycine betaine transport system ATPase subunit